MKIFNTIPSRIFLSIVLTVILVVGVIGVISYIRIDQGFNTFLSQEAKDIYGYGWGRTLDTEQKEQRHQQLIEEFKTTMYQSIAIASVIGAFIAILVSIFLSKQIANPIRLLSKQIKQISRNNYKEIKLNSSANEIKELIKDYNDLINELNRIEGLREDLVSDVTHELKTPLTKIVGQLEGCIDGIYNCDTEQLKKILNNVNQLEKLVSQLQELVEIKSGKSKLKLEDINLKTFIDDVLPGYKTTGIEITNDVTSNSVISADQGKLREILDNLISNAIRHTKKGEIRIAYSDNKLTVSDTGEGIEEKDLPYIFERFYRSDKSRNKETGGLGLGLAIVKELVELHGWKISVRSKVNEGTSFTIQISG